MWEPRLLEPECPRAHAQHQECLHTTAREWPLLATTREEAMPQQSLSTAKNKELRIKRVGYDLPGKNTDPHAVRKPRGGALWDASDSVASC